MQLAGFQSPFKNELGTRWKWLQVHMICALGLSSTQWARKKVPFFFPDHILDVIYEKNCAENKLGIATQKL